MNTPNTPESQADKSAIAPIPRFKEGAEDTPLSAARMNRMVDLLNAVARPTIRRGGSDGVFLADSGIVYQIAEAGSEEVSVTGGGNMLYRGPYNSSTDYAVNDVVIHPNTIALGVVRTLWICLIANGPSSAVHAPEMPEPGLINPGTRYWQALSYFDSFAGIYSSYSGADPLLRKNFVRGQIAYTNEDQGAQPVGTGRWLWFCVQENGPDTSAGVKVPTWPEPAGLSCYWVLLSGNPSSIIAKRCVIESIQQDHYVVKEVNASNATIGDSFNVAKPTDLRYSTGETIDGTAITYGSWTATTRLERTASITGYSEQQVIVPRIVVGKHIYAALVGSTGVASAPYWVDLNVDGRAWCKKWV